MGSDRGIERNKEKEEVKMGEWAEWLAEREDQEIANSYTNFDKILDRILKEHWKDKKELRICLEM